MGFEIIVGSKIMAQQVITLNRVEEELPSIADISKSDDIELQEITERVTKSMGDLIIQLKGEVATLPMHGQAAQEYLRCAQS